MRKLIVKIKVKDHGEWRFVWYKIMAKRSEFKSLMRYIDRKFDRWAWGNVYDRKTEPYEQLDNFTNKSNLDAVYLG